MHSRESPQRCLEILERKRMYLISVEVIMIKSPSTTPSELKRSVFLASLPW